MSAAHILVIDDDDDLRETISRFLIRAGYEVSQAPNGENIQSIMSERKVHLVLTDILMPVQEGIATIMVVRKYFADTKVIAMSGGGQVSGGDVLRAARALGAHNAINKPFDFDELVEMISNILNEAGVDAGQASYA